MDWHTAVPPLVIAHRGASHDAPENTLMAFGLAAEQGADGIELDVCLSADGWPVVIHDDYVERTTDGVGRVSQLTVAELRRFDAGEGQRIPTLDDVFQAFGPTLLYNVEIKDIGWRNHGLETAVADRIEAYHLENHVLISSFNPLSIRRSRRHLSRATRLAYLHHQRWSRFVHNILHLDAIHPHHTLIDETYMAWAKKLNYQVNTWTVDDPAEAQRLSRLGVYAIITNKPKVIRDSLESSS